MNTRKKITAYTRSGKEYTIHRVKLQGPWAIFFASTQTQEHRFDVANNGTEPWIWFTLADAIDTIERKWR